MPITRPRRTAILALATAIALVVTAAALARIGGSVTGDASTADFSGPTATAQRRDLATTVTLTGTLARADTTTIVFGGVPTPRRTAGGTIEPASATADATIETAALRTTGSTTTTSDTPTAAPQTCEPPTTTTSTSTTSTTTTSTTSTTTPPSTTTSTTTPCSPTPTTTPTTPSTAPTAPAQPAQPGPTSDQEPSTGARNGVAPDGGAGTVTGADDGTDSQTATITAFAAIGATATRGTVLYRADDEPVVVLLADQPLFRDLSIGVSDGTDVQAVEQNLVDLGLTDLSPDQHFGSATAAAVKSWEESLGRSNPDGNVSVGEVVLLKEPAAVLTHDAHVGDLIGPGDAVLTLGAESQVVETDVDATTAHDWSTTTTVSLIWGDDSTSVGTVSEVGRDVTAGEIQVVIALDQQSTNWPIGTDVQVLRTTAVRKGATAVPVSAVTQGTDGAAVRVVAGTTDHVVGVKLGIVDGGWVEITNGIEAGTRVRLPG